MRPNRGGDGRREAHERLLAQERSAPEREEAHRQLDVVFDFTGLHRPDVRDLTLILTARLQSAPGDRVWVRALPYQTWVLLRALGVAHLFHLYPYPNGQLD